MRCFEIELFSTFCNFRYKMEEDISNSWSVENIEVFHLYCCPECEFIHENLQEFSKHALENHILANNLFTQEKPIIKLEPLHEFTGDLIEDTLDIKPTDLEQLEYAYEKKDNLESDPLSFISGKSICNYSLVSIK